MEPQDLRLGVVSASSDSSVSHFCCVWLEHLLRRARGCRTPLSSSRDSDSKGLCEKFTEAMLSNNSVFVDSHLHSFQTVCAKPRFIAMSQRALIPLPRGDSPKYPFRSLRPCGCLDLISKQLVFRYNRDLFYFCPQEAVNRGLSLLFAGWCLEFRGN